MLLRRLLVETFAPEIYEKILYDGEKHFSIAQVDRMIDKTIIVNGCSKSYAMTGWRSGYAAGPKEVINLMGKIISQETSNACSITQKASLEALTGPQESVEIMRKAFEERRNYVVERLNKINGVICPKPKGAFYVFPEISSFYGSKIKNSAELCKFDVGT